MRTIETKFSEIILIEPKIYSDQRGFFKELYQRNRYFDLGIKTEFVQDNISYSQKNVLRGLHYQYKQTQSKLVSVIKGAVFDVVVDVRLGSPTYLEWYGVELSEENHRQLFIPEGFAHGFLTLTDDVSFIYKCSDFYNSDYECGLLWNDPSISIDWQVSNPILSQKDSSNNTIDTIELSKLPVYTGSTSK